MRLHETTARPGPAARAPRPAEEDVRVGKTVMVSTGFRGNYEEGPSCSSD